MMETAVSLIDSLCEDIEKGEEMPPWTKQTGPPLGFLS